ncbi:gluconate 2-dehydrogenase subunit 3 family protein [Cupriavidus sp. Marseille-Q8015]
MTPAECYRLGLAALDRACRAQYGGRPFAQLAAGTQDAVLAGLEAGSFALDALPGAVFFQMLLDGTIEGFFADPVYGGNRDMAGWKLVGFPGAMASFANDIERHNVPYARAPVSIATAPPHAMSMTVPPDRPVTFLAAADETICRSPASNDAGAVRCARHFPRWMPSSSVAAGPAPSSARNWPRTARARWCWSAASHAGHRRTSRRRPCMTNSSTRAATRCTRTRRWRRLRFAIAPTRPRCRCDDGSSRTPPRTLAARAITGPAPAIASIRPT